MKDCGVEGCSLPSRGKGYCNAHYQKYYRLGHPLAGGYHERHGMEKSREYSIWLNIKQRCRNRNNPNYHRYGGRGITICDKWYNSFSAFFSDMGFCPDKNYSIDRINNNGNYEPGNCRWADAITQANNQRTRKDNKSGVKGVFFDKNRSAHWVAYISRNKKRVHLGGFHTREMAIDARLKAEGVAT